MKTARIACLVMGVAGASSSAAAQSLPEWPITQICANDSAVGQCRLYERVARQEVVASWEFLPTEWRDSCLAAFRPPLEPSWRILADCFTERMSRSKSDSSAEAEAAADRAEEEARRKAE